MITKDKIIEVLKKIIQNKKYKDDTYPKIILKCPANKSGENKMEKAFWNVYFVLDNYLHDLFCEVDDDWDYDEYQVAFTENGAYDMPSDYLDLDELDAFYVDVSNALDVDGEYVIGCSGYYKSIEETNEVLKMSSKNSLIIDVDDFNIICDDLYLQALYSETIDKLFKEYNREHSFAADAKIVKGVCKAVSEYVSNLNNNYVHHTSYIKTDEIESLPDDYNVKVTFYIEGNEPDLKYYAKFKKYSRADIIKDFEEERKLKEAFKMELSIDSFKQLVNGTLNEINADVRLNIMSLVSNVGDVYFIKSVEMVKDMLLYYANERYTVDLNTSEFNDVCKNVDVTGFVVATFNAAIKPKRIKVEYQYFSTQEKMGESLYNTNRDKHSYYRGVIPSVYKEFENEKGNEEIEKNFAKISTKKELYEIVSNCALSENDILVIANNNGFLDLVRANVVMENIFNLVHQEMPNILLSNLNGKYYTDPMELSETLGKEGNPYLRYDCTKYSKWEKSNDIHVLSCIGSITDKTNKRIFTDRYGKMCTCINASDLFPIYLEIINEKENEKEGNNNMKTNVSVTSVKSDREKVHILVPKIDHVNYNEAKKTVIVFWATGETTKVKAMPEDKFDLYFGVQAAITKYVTGNTCERTESIIKTAVKKAINTEKKPKKEKKEETVLTIEPGKFDDVSLENKATKKPRNKKGSR